MARALWTGSISFGLVNIPVKLFPAIQSKDVHFHLVHDKDGGRIKEKRICSLDGEEVAWEHVVKGYEISKGKTIKITDDDLKQFAPDITHTVDIEQFVDLDEIDPLYYDHSYYIAPDKSGSKAYSLLTTSMSNRNKVAIARVVIRTRQSLCAIRPSGNHLVLSTMHYPDEIRDASEVTGSVKKLSQSKELDLADQLIQSLEKKFEPKDFSDNYREQLLTFVKKKAKGTAAVESPPKPESKPDVASLLDALSASLQRKSSSKPVKHRPHAKTRVRRLAHSRPRRKAAAK